MTAHALEGERERCLAAGMDDYISKPVKIERLKQTLLLWLVSIPSAQSVDQPTSPNVLNDKRDYLSVDVSVIDGLKELQPPDEPDIIDELIETFLADAARCITALKQAARCRDANVITAQAHALKSSSGSIGARHIEFLSEKLEEKDANAMEVEMLVTAIENEFQQVSRILSYIRQNSGLEVGLNH